MSSYLDKESSVIKDLSYGQNENSFAKLTREILSGQDRPILPARVANQNADFIHLARSQIQPHNQDFSLGTTKTFKIGWKWLTVRLKHQCLRQKSTNPSHKQDNAHSWLFLKLFTQCSSRFFLKRKSSFCILEKGYDLKGFFAKTNSSKCPKKEKRGGKKSKGSQKDGKPKVKC